MELSYVARRSGMTPIILGKPYMSPLKPALKNPEQTRSTKHKIIHFETPKTTSDQFVTPENSCNGKYCINKFLFLVDKFPVCILEDMNVKKKSTQGRTATPHIKILKGDGNCGAKKTQKATISSTNIDSVKLNKTTVKTAQASSENCSHIKKSTDVQQNNNDCMFRRSSRLANKPTKNYKY